MLFDLCEIHRVSLGFLTLFAVLTPDWLKLAHASIGDRDLAFRRCVGNCESTGCIELRSGTQQLAAAGCNVACPSANKMPVPAHLRLLRWSCTDDCRYRCMELRKQYTVDALEGRTCKYFGKWPFHRVLGIQEVLSAVFSIANLAAHVHNLYKLRSAQQTSWQLASQHPEGPAPHRDVMWGMWISYAVGSINAWFWSAVFHCRDIYLTERLDYLSADVSILIGLYVSLVKVFRFNNLQSRVLCAVPLVAAAGMHFCYMLFLRFDYGFNVRLCIAVGVLQQVIWCTWVLYNRHPCRNQLLSFVLLINVALSLEVLDFPPICGLLDAHSLWHLCTVPLIYLWYSFVFADAKFAITTATHSTAEFKQQ